MNNFSELGLTQPTLEAIKALGFEAPTSIQSQAIPKLLHNNRDFIGLAQTGTGKTAAFGLPLVELVNTDISDIQALIVAPTRELCMQIAQQMEAFAKYKKGLRTLAVYGGADIRTQIKKLKQGVHIVIATPGRLRDLMRRKVADISNIRYMVLDEADEMLNMGFRQEIDEILLETPPKKTIWLFSATMSKEVKRIASNFMVNPEELVIGNQNTSNQDIDHRFTFVRGAERYNALQCFLKTEESIYAIVFCRTRRDTKNLVDRLQTDGFRADALNGDLSQAQRDRVMNKFRDKKINILVATDVAARGIDVDNVSHIFHYNIPEDLDFYTHRSGRTGRAGNKGVSLVLAHPKDKKILASLERRLDIKFDFQKVPSGKEIFQQQLLKHFDEIKDATHRKEIEAHLPAIFDKLEGISRGDLIKMVAMHYAQKHLKSIPAVTTQEIKRDVPHHSGFKKRKAKKRHDKKRWSSSKKARFRKKSKSKG